MPFPSYVIAIVIILVILSVSISVYFILRKRRRGSVGADREQQEEYLAEKDNDNTSPYAVKPLMGYSNNNNNIENSSTLKDNSSSTSTIPPKANFEKTKNVYENNNKSTPTVVDDSVSSVWTNSDSTTPVVAAADVKISLPLPPPSSSFFSDKMELDSAEANDLYASYMNVAAQQQEYVSIDLDDKPFLSNAAANFQQKAATLRSTLTKSMRRKSTSGGIPKVALNQFFDNASSTASVKYPRPESTRMSRQSSSTSSRFPTRPSLQQPTIPPSPRPDSPSSDFFGKYSNNSSKKSLLIPDEASTCSNKLMIENIPPESYFSLPMSPSTPSPLTMRTTIQQQQELAQQQQQEFILQRQQAMAQKQQDDYSSMINEINKNDIPIEPSSSEEDEGDSDKENNNKNQQDAALAARKLIRSASRKSRTRSTIISEEAAQNMLALIANNTPSPIATNTNITTTTTSNTSESTKYNTLRKSTIEIDTASVRRPSNNINNNTSSLDIKNWSNNDSSPISPSPKRFIMSSTLSGSATVSGKKMARQQLLASSFNNSSDDLYNNRQNTESVTLGRKSGSEKKESPTSLRNLFSRPDDNKVAPLTIKKEEVTKNIDKKEETVEQEEEDSQSAIITPSSPIIADSPSSSKNNTLRKMGNNVDTIRRMLQSSWSGNNLKESGSSNSLSSSDYMGSVGSSYRPIASPLGSVNPRLQNQHLVSLSLKANAVQQQGRSRPSMPVGFMNEGEGPIPTASFSSSTVRTMIPADEEENERSKPKSVMSNILGSRQPRQPSKLGERVKKPTGKKTPAQIEREKYLKSLET